MAAHVSCFYFAVTMRRAIEVFFESAQRITGFQDLPAERVRGELEKVCRKGGAEKDLCAELVDGMSAVTEDDDGAARVEF